MVVLKFIRTFLGFQCLCCGIKPVNNSTCSIMNIAMISDMNMYMYDLWLYVSIMYFDIFAFNPDFIFLIHFT